MADVGFGNGYFVAVVTFGVVAAYSTNGITWTALQCQVVLYGNPLLTATVICTAVQASGTTAGAYYAFTPAPVAYGIYNGATVRA